MAAYVADLKSGKTGRAELNRQLMQLALPSLGQWVGIVRELARFYSVDITKAPHPLGHLYEQLSKNHRDCPALLSLYQRIKKRTRWQGLGYSKLLDSRGTRRPGAVPKRCLRARSTQNCPVLRG